MATFLTFSPYFIGFFTFLQNKKSLNNISFFLVCLSINLWLFGASLLFFSQKPSVGLFWYKYVTFFGVVNIAPSIYFFSVTWLNLLSKKKLFVKLGYVFSFSFYFSAVFTDYTVKPFLIKHYWGFYPRYGSIAIFFIMFFK